MSDNTNKGAVFFVTLIPDDYHGWPMVDQISENGDFEIPSEDDVFSAWAAAGYNAWNFDNPDNVSQDPEDEDYDPELAEEDLEQKELDCFEEWGESPLYYAAYMIITEDDQYFEKEQISFHEVISDLVSISEDFKIEPEELCEIVKKECPEISVIIPIRK